LLQKINGRSLRQIATAAPCSFEHKECSDGHERDIKGRKPMQTSVVYG
jgi:hypothetical protein